MKHNLDYIFQPQSIAVVGVSQDPTKLGSVFFNNLIESGFKGKLYPVNPKGGELYGYPAYKQVSDIPGTVDQVAILIPVQFVLDVVKDCARKKVKNLLIISAGFGELGKEGKAIQDQIVEIAQKSQMRIVGPNIIGVQNPWQNLNSSWAQKLPQPGNIAFVSQSGAFCTSVLDMALSKNVGFANFVSVGNKADVDETELIEYWHQDDLVKVIGVYTEEITHGLDMMQLLADQKKRKPVVMYKPGKTEEAVKAIASHTGSMAGSVQTVQTAIQQNGIVEANTASELFNVLMTFSWIKNMPQGKRVAVITNAGGPGIMATDAIATSDLEIAQLSEQTKKALCEVLPCAASVNNPVDVLGDALADRYAAATEILLADPNVDMILYVLTPQYITQIEETAKVVTNNFKFGQKPVFAVFLGDKTVKPGLQKMYDNQVPAFGEIVDAVFAMNAVYNYQNFVESLDKKSISARKKLLTQAGKGKYTDQVNAAIKAGETTLDEALTHQLAAEVGISLPRQLVASSVEEAVKFAHDKYPVVIKAPNDAIAHKTDFKALYLNLSDDQDFKEKYALLEATIKKHTDIKQPKILVQEMITAREELIIGANRDGNSDVYQQGTPGFGHLLVFGKGGIYTEVYKDLAYALAPASQNQIAQALASTKTYRILEGTRGQAKLATDKVLKTIEAVQKLVILYPQIASLDINPLLVTEDRAVAVDIKVFIG